jgi:hypothetical protein
MGKRSDRLPPKKTPAGSSAAAEEPAPDVPAPTKSKRRADRFPIWGWALAFCVPLVLSEGMFRMVGKTGSMILFPIAWIGFWIALMQRSGWPILKRRKEGSGTEH